MKKMLRAALPVVLLAAAVPVVVFGGHPAEALDNGLARTPQLGWNDWNSFGCNVSDALIRQTADAMVNSGMAAAGYTYVNIDDCWSERSRDPSGNLVPSRSKFPNGIKAVADYVHGKGLKLGIYSSAGLTTCAGYPASLGNEQRDANLWASWGIDYLKYDNCGQQNGISGPARYAAMRDALARSGRSILFAICNWGNDNVRSWGPSTGNSWRTTGDIEATWSSVLGILDAQPAFASASGPGAWNDPDMLEVGNGLSDTESRAHFSLWALLNAPLIAGNDLRTMSAATRSILTNTEVIAVNQDWGGRQGNRIVDNGDSEVWSKPMANGSVAVVLLNRGQSTATISTSAAQLGLASSANFSVRDLWAHSTATSAGTISASVPAHGVAMYLVSRGAGTTTTSTTTTSTTTTSGGSTGGTFALRGGGQKCSACSRVVVLEPVYDTFVQRFVEATKSLNIGETELPSTQVGPVIDANAHSRIREYIDKGKAEAKVALEMPAPDNGYFIGPVIFKDVSPNAVIAQEEIFGPVVAVIRVKDFKEALEVANGTNYALTGGLYSRTPSHIQQAQEEFEVGNLYINRTITGAIVARQPFGGFKLSGVGSKAGGPDYLLQFLEPRTVTENIQRQGFAPIEGAD